MSRPKLVTNARSFDVESFRDVAPASLTLDEIRETKDYAEHTDLIEDMMIDGFCTFYKWESGLSDRIPADREVTKRVVQQLQQLPETEQLRKHTVGNEINSISTMDTVFKIYQELPDHIKQRQDNVESAMKDLEQALLTEDPSTDAGADAIRGIITELDRLKKLLDESLDASEDEIRKCCRVAIREATDRAQESIRAMMSLGYDDSPGDLNGKHDRERLKLAKTLERNPKLREILKLAGRFCYIADKKQREKSEYQHAEVSGIEIGDDLQRVTPSDLALLSDEDTEGIFFLKYIEKSLQLYRITGTETMGEGPIAVMVDCSISMNGYKDVWSKAMALASYFIARKQKRDFALILFNTEIKKEIYIRSGTESMEGLVDILTVGVNGGTRFEGPIDFTIDNVLTRSEFTKADLIFITDGECSVSDQWKETYQSKKAEMEFSTFGILIGVDFRGTLKSLSDEFVHLQDDILNNEEEAFELFSL